MKKLEVTISPTGEVTIGASGYTGNDCLAATKKLEEALGLVEKRTRKAPEATVGTTVKTKG